MPNPSRRHSLRNERARTEASGSPRTWRDVLSSCQHTVGIDVDVLLVAVLLACKDSIHVWGLVGRVPRLRQQTMVHKQDRDGVRQSVALQTGENFVWITETQNSS